MTRFGNLRGILDAPLEELQVVEGIGAVTPAALRIIREAASLYLQQAAEQCDSFTDPSALARFWRKQIGSLSHEVFAALRRGAATLVFAHNHPNGKVQPTEQDKVLTRVLVLAAATVQIQVFDHLIVCTDTVFS